MISARCCCLMALLLSACASTARITGGFADYRSYREARLAPTLEGRLSASERYLQDFPRGDYREQVRAWFSPAEARYFKLAWDNLPRLRAYLDAMPRGPHAAAVSDRITQLESRRVFAERRLQRSLEAARVLEARFALAAGQRRELLREFARLVGLLAATRSFGKRDTELEPALLQIVQGPAPACADEQCSAAFKFPYAVPNDKILTERVAEARLQVTFKNGRMRELSLSGPELLTRVAEAVEVRAVRTDNPQAHAEALGHALDVVADALDASLPKARCAAEAVSPVVLSRRCGQVRLDVVAGTEAGVADRISVVADRH